MARHPFSPSLADRMAAAARELQGQVDPAHTMQAAVELAVSNIDGCDAAGISIVHARGRIGSPAVTSQDVSTADRLQYETGEGPCLDAIWQERTVHSPDLTRDDRWRVWGPAVAEATGLRSCLAFRLFTTGDTVGALNLYAEATDAFDADDRDEGLALAAHISVAVAASRQISNLMTSNDTRAVIGQAMGIAMERYDIDAVQAWSLLVRISSQSETKIRDLAVELVETRTLPGG